MPESQLSFNLQYVYAVGPEQGQISFTGPPHAPASEHIVAALRAQHLHVQDNYDFKLSPSDVMVREDAWDTQFLLLSGEETLADLRALIGPDDAVAVLRQSSWGGGEGPAMFTWVVSDFLPFARGMLEVYGAVEVMRVTGRAIEAKRFRTVRQDASYWVRGGYGEVHSLLREEVYRYQSWTVPSLRKHFNLSDGDAGRLMAACGYSYDPASETYFLLDSYGN